MQAAVTTAVTQPQGLHIPGAEQLGKEHSQEFGREKEG